MMGLVMSAYNVPLLLLYSPFVLSKAFESIDFEDYDSGADIGWDESGACGRLWSDFSDLLVQLVDAFGLAHGEFKHLTYYLWICICRSEFFYYLFYRPV